MQSVLPSSALQCLQLLHLLYHVDFTVFNSQAELDSFVARHRFHPIQYLFSSNSFRQLLCDLEEDQVFFITDTFLLHCLLFYIEGVPVVFGPFASVILMPRDVKTLQQRYHLSDVTESDLLHYTNSYPCLSDSEAIHIVCCLLHLLYPDEPARRIIHIDSREALDFESEDRLMGMRADYTRLLEKRYAYEESFIQNVAAGHARKAIHDLSYLQMDVAYLKRIGTTLENERIGSAIVRTMARLAAIKAGLPCTIVDRISSDNTVATRNASTVENIIKAKEKMVRELCRAVQTYKSQKYSALVQSAVYYMEQEYAQDITVQSLAEQLDVSVNHLISVFRKEMNVTPNVYLRQIRMKQAARLLAATDQSVQDIASNVGISDSNYLIKLFKTQFGETPTAYRKKYRV